MKLNSITVFVSIGLVAISSMGHTNNLDLPDLGDIGAASLTVEQEKRTGEAVVHKLRRAGLIVDDPLLTGYLNQLGYQLLSHHDTDNPIEFNFFLVNDNEINAFALPGGFIGINYGLIMASETESELASVLAHEIAHVTQRHYARAYNLGSQSELPIIAALIAAIILGSQGSDIGQAALATVAAASAQSQINFTRHNEEEADRIGIHLLAKAGYDAEKMADFFDKLDKQARLYGGNIPEFLRTHPVNSSRISDAKNRARLLKKPIPRSSANYLIMRNRVIALGSQDKKSVEKTYKFNLQNQNKSQRLASRYGYTLTLIRNNKFKLAKKNIAKLLAAEPHRIAFMLASAEINYKSGNSRRAYQTYEKALSLYPGNPAITYDYSELLIRDKKYQQATALLEQFIKKPPKNPMFYKFLAQARSNNRDNIGTNEAMAEYYYQIGQIHQAIEQLNIALKSKKLDFYTLSRLEARLVHIKEEAPRGID